MGVVGIVFLFQVVVVEVVEGEFGEQVDCFGRFWCVLYRCVEGDMIDFDDVIFWCDLQVVEQVDGVLCVLFVYGEEQWVVVGCLVGQLGVESWVFGEWVVGQVFLQ